MNPISQWQPQDYMWALFAFTITYFVAFARGYTVGRKQERDERRESYLKQISGRR